MLRRHRLGPRRYEPFVPLLARLASGLPLDLASQELNNADVFVEAALYHGVAGQVLAAASRGRVRLRPDAARALEAGHATSMVRGALLRAELPRVGAVIAAACGTASILVKGPALADRYYADRELRPFEDLDFMLPRERVDAAAAALQDACGYSVVPLPWPRNLERHGHAVELYRELGVHALGLELHWRISDDPLAVALDHAHLIAGASELAGAAEILVPGRSDQLLLLALHLMHHSEKRLIWLIDIMLVSQAAKEEEWLTAFRLADALGLGWVLHRALDESEHRLGFCRPRPGATSAPHGWGPLRAAQAIGGPVGYHGGHLATLPWRAGASYLVTGVRGRLGGAARQLTRRR